MTDIFENSGRIRADIAPESIQPDRRAAFAALVSAQAECDQAEANEQAAVERVEDCVRIYNEAEAHVPRQTITELVKETFNLT